MSLTFQWSISSLLVGGKQILSNVAGEVKGGELYAVMGTSGAGKSSLLNVLSGRNLPPSKLKIQGRVTVNGEPREKDSFNALSAYVEQETLLSPYLTTLETLEMFAQLRLPASLTRQEKCEAARKLAIELGLSDCLHTKIGEPMGVRGVSGGERKRISIAVDLLMNPKILFLDEPTSGLDSETSLHLMKTVKILASQDRIVICTIHQPQQEIFNLFDQLLLLSQGKMVFAGQVVHVHDFFASHSLVPPLDMNPADFYIEVCTVDDRAEGVLAASQARVDRLVGSYPHFKSSRMCEQSSREDRPSTEQMASSTVITTESSAGSQSKESRLANSRLSWFVEMLVLYKYLLLSLFRDSTTVIVYIAQALVAAIYSGLVAYNTGKDQDGVFKRGGILFFAVLSAAFANMVRTGLLLFLESGLIKHGLGNGSFRPSTYLAARMLSLVTLTLPIYMIYSIIQYSMVGFREGVDHFFLFLLFLVMAAVSAQLFGIVSVVVVFESPKLMLLSLNLCIAFQAEFSGAYFDPDSCWAVVSWIQHIIPSKYLTHLLLLNEFEGTRFSCDAGSPLCLDTGDKILRYFGINAWERLWQQFGYLLLVMFAQMVLAIFSLWRVGRRQLNVEICNPSQEEAEKLTGIGEFALDNVNPLYQPQGEHNSVDVSSFPIDDVILPEKVDVVESANVGSQDNIVQMSEPVAFQHIRFEWCGVGYSIPNVARPLLQNQQGCVESGQLVCILGSSGGGKTSLLNVLAGRNVQGVVTGSINLNGAERNTAGFSRISAYVEQDNFLFPMLTVLETLEFSAALRLPKSMSESDKKKKAKDIALELGLGRCLDSRIGDQEMPGISGGERRRVSVGVDLLTDPKIIFLDEATSGLDSHTAYLLIRKLKSVAHHHGMAVICTIHQPRSDVFALFDKLVLMSQGQVVYEGYVKGVRDFFVSSGLEPPIGVNPADFYVEMASVNTRGSTEQAFTQERVDSLVQKFRDTGCIFSQDLSNKEKEEGDYLEILPASETTESSPLEVSAPLERVSWWTQLRALVKRRFKMSLRDPRAFKLQLVSIVSLCIIVGLLGLQIGDDQAGVYSRRGLSLITGIFTTLTTGGIFIVFYLDLPMVIRETKVQMYGLLPFYVSVILVDGILIVIANSIGMTIFYVLLGFQYDWEAYGFYLLLVHIAALGSITFSHFLASLCPDLKIVSLIYPIWFLIPQLSTTFFSPTPPKAIAWMKYVSGINYCFEGTVINEFDGLRFTCEQNTSCIYTGEQALTLFHLDDVSQWGIIWQFCVYVCVFFFLGYIALRWRLTLRLPFM